MTLRLRQQIGVLLVVLVLTACGGADATPTPVGPAPATPAPATPDPKVPLVTYVLSGGIAGIQKGITIWPDGRVELTDHGKPAGSTMLDAQQLSDLTRLIAATHFPTLQDRYDNGRVADDMYDAVIIGGKTVTAAQVGGESLTPPALLDLISFLERISKGLKNATTSTPEASTTDPPRVASLLTYEVSGGIAGRRATLEIWPDGQARVIGRGIPENRFSLSSGDLAQVQAALATAQQANLAARYGYAVPDDILTTLSFAQDGQPRMVTISQANGGSLPTPLRDLITGLAAIATKAAPGFGTGLPMPINP